MYIIDKAQRILGIEADFTSTYPDVLLFLSIWIMAIERSVMTKVIETIVVMIQNLCQQK